MKPLILIFLLSTIAHASIDSVPNDPVQMLRETQVENRTSLAPAEIYSRTQTIFRHFNVPAEGSEDAFLKDLDRAQNASGVARILKVVDASSQWKRFSESQKGITQSFLDRDSKLLPDFSVEIVSDGQALASVSHLKERIAQIAAQSGTAKPLNGLRVALDPGHMGGDGSDGGEDWDALTGKYIIDSHGAKLSEGVLNLQTALLLEQLLQSLGAETLVTHRDLAPVTSIPLHALDLQEFGRKQVLSLSLSSWFQALLDGPAGSALPQRFDSSSSVKTLFSESARNTDFILGADLDARAQVIEEFHPDVTLIIHYDIDLPNGGHGVNPSGRDAVKTYLPGAFAPEEFAGRHDRALMAKHLYDAESWDASLLLSRDVAEQIHQSLGISKEVTSAGSTVEIEPGVLGRNLALTRKLYGHAITYVECAYYNNGREFALMRNATHPMSFHGKSHPYSDRTLQVATALKDAIVHFVDSFRVGQ